MEIEVSELGLAAYLRLKKVPFIEYNSQIGAFVFTSNKTLDEWRVEYLSTDCYQHDKEVMSLRQFKQKRGK